MHVHLQNDVPGNASGMGKFFSPTNLHRYRSLTDNKTDAGERARVLKVLAEEWEAFTRDCRMGSAVSVGSSTSFAKGGNQK
jgi:hypothetical protein